MKAQVLLDLVLRPLLFPREVHNEILCRAREDIIDELARFVTGEISFCHASILYGFAMKAPLMSLLYIACGGARLREAESPSLFPDFAGISQRYRFGVAR